MTKVTDMEWLAILSGQNRFRWITILGEGGYGSVCLAEYLSGENPGKRVALKLILNGNSDETSFEYLMREIVNHMNLNHNHIIKIEDILNINGKLIFVMEYANRGTLTERINEVAGGLGEAQARWYFNQVVLAVDFCHARGTCIRDIKPDNILLDGCIPGYEVVKLCDFGFSKGNQHSAADTNLGTIDYMPPEILRNDSEARNIPVYDGRAADIWSLGVTLYTMVMGSHPFSRKEEDANLDRRQRRRATYKRHMNLDYHLSDNLSSGFRDLISRMLTVDPLERITARDIMYHPWFKEDLTEPRYISTIESNNRQISAAQTGPFVTPAMEEQIRRVLESVGFVSPSDESSETRH